MHRIALLALLACALLAGCAIDPPRSDEQFSHVQRGMTREDVQRLIGPPDETMSFPLSHTQAWDYRYQDSWGYMAVYSVTFGPEGQAVSTLSRRINIGGDHGR